MRTSSASRARRKEGEGEGGHTGLGRGTRKGAGARSFARSGGSGETANYKVERALTVGMSADSD